MQNAQDKARAALSHMIDAGMMIRPVKTKVVVLQDPPSRVFDRGGLIVKPECSFDDPKDLAECVVLSTGDDVDELRVGDVCLFRRRGGTALTPDDRDLRAHEARTGAKHPWENVLVLDVSFERNGKRESDFVAVIEGA